MGKIIYPDLSYQIVGILYKVHNKLGWGYQERYYQIAIRRELERIKMPYLEQVRAELNFYEESLGRYFIDFIIDGKIVLEIKSKSFFSPKDVRQVLAYLKRSRLELGILAGFGGRSLICRRILRGFENPKSSGEFVQSGINSGINIREFGTDDISDKLG